MNRRSFIRNTSLFFGAQFSPGWKLFGNQFIKTKLWMEILDYARWCPSPHNVQPWLVKIISDTEAHLYYDPSRIPIAADGTTAFTTVGMGMFVECLSIAANNRGYIVTEEHDSEEEMNADGKIPQLFARLNLRRSGQDVHKIDRELIKKRKTSRMQYDNRIIDPALVEKLQSIASSYGHEFTYTSNPEVIDYTIRLNNESILFRSNEEEARLEMLRWIRTSDQEAALKKDGWWYKCVGVPRKMLYNFFAHRDRFNSKSKRKQALKMLNKNHKGTRNLAWISGSFESKSDWIKAGFMLQRMWLEITRHNVYLSPYGPLVTTPTSLSAFKQKIDYNKHKGSLWFLIRLGYSDDPPRSYRLNIEDILI